jgi:hypothetical protein
MKNIDERVKNELVDAQIKYLKEKQPSELINYGSLRKYLSESISEYFPDDLLNKTPDYNLLNELDNIKTENWKGEAMSYQAGRVARLVNKIKDTSKTWRNDEEMTNKEFVEFYKIAQNGKIYNYGAKTHQLLKDYLTKKNLI